MKYLIASTVLVLTTLVAVLFCGCSSGNTLISEGKSNYKIFVSAGASEPEQYAATELQKYLEKISGCKLPITHQAGPEEQVIYVGFQEVPPAVLSGLDTARFGNEEYLIRSDGRYLLLAGGGSRGTLYGVLGYLSDYLGCRWYTREVVKVPPQSTLRLHPVEDRQRPAFEYREAWYREAYDTEWALHNRLNPSIVPLPDSLGGSYITYPFVHTFYQLVPPERYFAGHPEYFSEVNGVRRGKDAQLCLTNPEVVNIATRQVLDWIEEHPRANVFSVDQNDGEGYCTCTNCRALDEAEGSHAGSLLAFVNQIADTVAKHHPAIKLQTLAYAYTEVPPKNLRPADNLTIRLCHYNYCSAHPIEACTHHERYRERLAQWKSIAKRITIWDYFTDFAHYLMPFPNFETLKHDVKFYADQGVIGLFAQGNNVPKRGGGEFSELRAWVLAQLMWNPEQDAQALVDEFVQQVYGAAAPYLSEYIRLLHEQVQPDSVYFSIWSQPTEVNYLGLATIQQADSLFERARQAAAADTALAARVELAYLPVLYTKLFFYSIGGTAYLSRQDMPLALARFNRLVAKHQISAIGDVPETYGNLSTFLKKVASAAPFYTDWWIVGPFENEDQKGLARVLAPERGFGPDQTYLAKNGQRVAWRKYQDTTSGYIDFSKLFSPNENVVAYAYRTLYAEKAQAKTFGVGSNDGVRVWINWKLVLDRPVARKAEPNQDRITVMLPKGESAILVKVDQLKRGWGFYFTEIPSEN